MLRLTAIAMVVATVAIVSYVIVGGLTTGYAPLSEKEMLGVTGSQCVACYNRQPWEKGYVGDGNPPACDGYFLKCQRDDFCEGGLLYGYCACLDDGSETVSCDKYDATRKGDRCEPGEKLCSNCESYERSRCKNPSGDPDCATA
jgi:hypothetical protein